MASSSSGDGQAPRDDPPAGSSSTQRARGFAAAWASKLGQKASEIKAATKDAMQQTKEAIAAEAKCVAKDMADLKEGVAEGVRLTVKDTKPLRERIGQQTRKVFASKDAQPSEASAPGAKPEGEEEAGASGSKSFFGPETAEHLKEKVQDLKVGGKKAAEKVLDVGGKLWHKTDHWFHQLRGDVHQDCLLLSWEECHQHAVQLYEETAQPGEMQSLAWTLEELKTGTLQVYAKSAVIFHYSDTIDEGSNASTGSSQSAAPASAAYCQTPLRTETQRCDVHIFSYSPSLLDISPFMDDAQRKAVRDKLKWLCYNVSACASQHHLSSICWHLQGGLADVSFLENDSADITEEGLQELCKVMMKDQLKAFPEVDLVTARLPDIPSYFDTPGSEEHQGTLFVSCGEPWQGPPVQGVFGSCTAVALLCRPATNPYLKASQEPKQSTATAATDDLEQAVPTGAELVIGDDDEDLLDVKEPPAQAPAAAVSSSSTSNGAGADGNVTGGYPTEEVEAKMAAPAASAAPATLEVSGKAAAAAAAPVTLEEEADWLDELIAEPPAAGPSSTAPEQPLSPTSPEKNIVDADFDALWDSMMDDEVEAPKKDVANGAA